MLRNTFVLFIAFIYGTPVNALHNYVSSISIDTDVEILSTGPEGLIYERSNQLYHRIPSNWVHTSGNPFYPSGKNQIKKNVFPQSEDRLSDYTRALHYLIHSKILLIKFEKKDIIFPFHFFW